MVHLNKFSDPILITGPPRSGTSMIAGIINLCGAWGGEMIGSHQENPKGFYENIAIKKTVFEPYLFGLDYDLLHRREIPAYRTNRRIPKLREKIIKIIQEQGYHPKDSWFYKSPMMCLVWHAWQDAFPNAKWIFVRRDLEENAGFCMKTSWMTGLTSKEDWQKYCMRYNRRMNRMKSAKVDYMDIWPQNAVDGKLSEIKKMVKWLGLDYRKDEVNDFIMPEVWG